MDNAMVFIHSYAEYRAVFKEIAIGTLF